MAESGREVHKNTISTREKWMGTTILKHINTNAKKKGQHDNGVQEGDHKSTKSDATHPCAHIGFEPLTFIYL